MWQDDLGMGVHGCSWVWESKNPGIESIDTILLVSSSNVIKSGF